MAKRTLQQRFVSALLARGETEVKRTSRYVVLTDQLTTRSGPDNPFYFYVGRSGGLRQGRTVALSFPVSEKFKSSLLASEK